jgi:hypothetical protein
VKLAREIEKVALDAYREEIKRQQDHFTKRTGQQLSDEDKQEIEDEAFRKYGPVFEIEGPEETVTCHSTEALENLNWPAKVKNVTLQSSFEEDANNDIALSLDASDPKENVLVVRGTNGIWVNGTVARINRMLEEVANYNHIIWNPLVRMVCSLTVALIIAARVALLLPRTWPVSESTFYWGTVMVVFYVAAYITNSSVRWLYPFVEFLDRESKKRSKARRVVYAVVGGIVVSFLYDIWHQLLSP